LEKPILVNSIKVNDFLSNELAWERWSVDQPKLAAILWPAIQQIAIYHAYFVIPELLAEIERTEPKESKIREKIAKFSISGALLQSERLVVMEDWDQALETIRWGLSFVDNDRGETASLARLRELLRLTTPHVTTAGQ